MHHGEQYATWKHSTNQLQSYLQGSSYDICIVQPDTRILQSGSWIMHWLTTLLLIHTYWKLVFQLTSWKNNQIILKENMATLSTYHSKMTNPQFTTSFHKTISHPQGKFPPSVARVGMVTMPHQGELGVPHILPRWSIGSLRHHACTSSHIKCWHILQWSMHGLYDNDPYTTTLTHIGEVEDEPK
jgi:hypothetical protein